MTRILVIGGGYAGVAAVERLGGRRPGIEVLLVDQRPDQESLPLLPDVIGRGFPPEHLRYPLARCAERWGCQVLQETVASVDLGRRLVTTAGRELAYDLLLVSGGAEPNYHGQEAFREHALPLYSAADAVRLRQAALDPQWETFVVAGGGYTGVEAATALWRLFRRQARPRRIVIAELAPALLANLPERLRDYVTGNLRKLGIELRLGTTVSAVTAEAVTLRTGEVFPSARLVWSAGVRTVEFVRQIDHRKTPDGRLLVDPELRIREDCFVAGDAAAFMHGGRPLRMAVQFAVREGQHAAGNMLRAVRGKPLRPFRPVELGYLVPMANNRACGIVLGMPMSGAAPIALHYAMGVYRARGLASRLGLLRSLLWPARAAGRAH
jgi:NADH dehydrogenase